MKSGFLEQPGLRVTIDDLVYQPQVADPAGPRHCFAYYITVHNESALSFTIKGRKWVVTNSRGMITAVEGDGVVGQFPLIEAGQTFSYNSFHLIDTRMATAEGSYLGIDGQGQTVLVRIPRFIMQVPTETFLV